MSKKLDLDIRGLIKEGKLSDKRMGQLLALDTIESTLTSSSSKSLLSDADERAIRASGKPEVLNKYIDGANTITQRGFTELGLLGGIIEGLNNELRQLYEELKIAYSTTYCPPTVIALTEEAYKKEGLKKRERRLKRKYPLSAILALILRDIVDNPRDNTEKEAVKDCIKNLEKRDDKDSIRYLKGDITPKDREEYTLDQLILPSVDSIKLLEVVQKRLDKDFPTLMTALKLTSDDKRITDDPYNLVFKGEILADIKADYLQEALNSTESYPDILDDYDDNDITDMRINGWSVRRLYEQYDQTYSIIKDTSKFKGEDMELDEGVLNLSGDRVDYKEDGTDKNLFIPSTNDFLPLFAYRATYKKGSLANWDKPIEEQYPLHKITPYINTIEGTAKRMLLIYKWLDKSLSLLGASKSEMSTRFLHGEGEELTSPYALLDKYALYRSAFLYHFTNTYVKPEYQDYHLAVLKALRPIFEDERKLTPEEEKDNKKCKVMDFTILSEKLHIVLSYNSFKKDDNKELIEAHFMRDAGYREASEIIENMELGGITSVLSTIFRDYWTNYEEDK